MCPRAPARGHQGALPRFSNRSATGLTANCWRAVINNLRNKRPQMGPAFSIVNSRVNSGERPIAICFLYSRQSANLLELKSTRYPDGAALQLQGWAGLQAVLTYTSLHWYEEVCRMGFVVLWRLMKTKPTLGPKMLGCYKQCVCDWSVSEARMQTWHHLLPLILSDFLCSSFQTAFTQLFLSG